MLIQPFFSGWHCDGLGYEQDEVYPSIADAAARSDQVLCSERGGRKSSILERDDKMLMDDNRG
jgi:hypothetical protein